MALASCTSEEGILGGDTSKEQKASNLTQVSAITRAFGEGSMGVGATKVGIDLGEVYVLDDVTGKPVLVDKGISSKYVNVICNKGTGFFHGENGWAVKSYAAGLLDNNRHTYGWFVNENGEKTSIEPNKSNDQGLLIVGDQCDLSNFNQNGKRAIVNVGDAWFDNAFSSIEKFIEEAKNTPATIESYAGQNPGETSRLTFESHEYNGYKVIFINETAFLNGSVAGTNDQAKAPWCVGNWNSYETDGLTTTVDHNIIIVPSDDVVFEGRNMNCHIFAPGKKVSLLNGACPSGLVVCDELFTTSEIHGNTTPEFFPGPDDPDEPETTCETNLLIDLGISSEYIVIADDFAIQNGDKLYMNAAIDDHTGVTDGDGKGKYVFVERGEDVRIRVDDICSLYPSYVGKTNEEGMPYINEDGVLTLVVYLWPGQLGENGEFKSFLNLGEGYVIGEENEPVQHSINDKDYTIMVSAYKGYQGRGEKVDGSVDNEGWSYVKVSIHIQPKANND